MPTTNFERKQKLSKSIKNSKITKKKKKTEEDRRRQKKTTRVLEERTIIKRAMGKETF